jgi:hypothetical protein
MAPAVDTSVHAGQRSSCIVAFDYLRTFGVLLVVLHHTLLAYSNFGFLNPYAQDRLSPMSIRIQCVFDAQRPVVAPRRQASE